MLGFAAVAILGSIALGRDTSWHKEKFNPLIRFADTELSALEKLLDLKRCSDARNSLLRAKEVITEMNSHHFAVPQGRIDWRPIHSSMDRLDALEKRYAQKCERKLARKG